MGTFVLGKKVYDRVISRMCIVEVSVSIPGSIVKDTGIMTDLWGSKICSVKQKHAILKKYFPACGGETLYTAVPDMIVSEVLVAV